MKKNKLLIGITTTIAVGLIIYFLVREKSQAEEQLEQVADAGYETAHDILYPLKKGSKRWRRI